MNNPPTGRRKLRSPLCFSYLSERFLPYADRVCKNGSIAPLLQLSSSLLLYASLSIYLRTQALPVSTVSQTSQILDLQGNVIDTFHAGENRQSVPLKDISPLCDRCYLGH